MIELEEVKNSEQDDDVIHLRTENAQHYVTSQTVLMETQTMTWMVMRKPLTETLNGKKDHKVEITKELTQDENLENDTEIQKRKDHEQEKELTHTQAHIEVRTQLKKKLVKWNNYQNYEGQKKQQYTLTKTQDKTTDYMTHWTHVTLTMRTIVRKKSLIEKGSSLKRNNLVVKLMEMACEVVSLVIFFLYHLAPKPKCKIYRLLTKILSGKSIHWIIQDYKVVKENQENFPLLKALVIFWTK